MDDDKVVEGTEEAVEADPAAAPAEGEMAEEGDEEKKPEDIGAAPEETTV